ncbi:hypothetical protein PybrP1_012041 [[Pythium] brassicae (nom. inval.)]|nr:hypothetical protein PybrP1_012041 [[Pythium] brassicae (nom. inval.)]
MKTAAVLAATVALIATTSTTQVAAHGGMTTPQPRAIRTMGLSIDSTFGHPIPMRASYTNGKGGDCINFTQDKNLQPLATGKSKIKMRANDGANHVGPCTVYLVDPTSNSKRIEVGSMKDCMRSLHPGPGSKGTPPIPAEMEINVPTSGLPCRDGHCVLQFVWEAQHISPSEFYNNCADVKIDGGSSRNDDPPPTQTQEPPAQTQPPATQPPATGGGGKWCAAQDVPGLADWCKWNCEAGNCPASHCKSC